MIVKMMDGRNGQMDSMSLSLSYSLGLLAVTDRLGLSPLLFYNSCFLLVAAPPTQYIVVIIIIVK